MNINLAIDDLRNNLINTINESGLPIGVVELICKEVYTKVQNAYIATINSEKLKDAKSPEEIQEQIRELAPSPEELFKEEQNE